MKKATKSVVVELLGGRSLRILKESVVAIEEQRTIMGGEDVEIYLKSGKCLISSESKAELERKFER